MSERAWQPSPELRERIRTAVTDLTEAREIPPERFPGHKATYCANLEGWLGGFTLGLLNALEATEADLAALREAAQAAHGDLLKAANQFAGLGFERNAARFEEKAERLRAVLASADSESREETP